MDNRHTTIQGFALNSDPTTWPGQIFVTPPPRREEWMETVGAARTTRVFPIDCQYIRADVAADLDDRLRFAIEMAEQIAATPWGTLWNHGTAATEKDRIEWAARRETALGILRALAPDRESGLKTTQDPPAATYPTDDELEALAQQIEKLGWPVTGSRADAVAMLRRCKGGAIAMLQLELTRRWAAGEPSNPPKTGRAKMPLIGGDT
jgi:hypothetical protein